MSGRAAPLYEIEQDSKEMAAAWRFSVLLRSDQRLASHMSVVDIHML